MSALATFAHPTPADAIRLPGLDAVRAVAIAAVLAYHLNVPGLFNAGFLGVDVFFNLSGFLITSLLLREYSGQGRVDIGRYFWRRFVRLMPAVAALLVVTSALTPVLLPDAERRLRADLPWALVYLANWWQICSAQSYFENFGHAPLLRHLWSLGVEMQFYVLWPWAVVALLRLAGVRGLFAASALLALASGGWMALLFGWYPDNASRAYLGADSHSMGLFLGAAMACWWSPLHPVALMRAPLPRWARWALGSAASTLLVALMWFGNEAQPLLYQGGFLLASLASVVLLISWADQAPATAAPALWRLGAAAVQWLGTRSYSIYLWHWPIFIYLKGNSTPRLWIVAQCLILTAIFAESSYRWIEGALSFTTRQWPAFRQRGAGYLGLGLLLLGGLAVTTAFACRPPSVAVANPHANPAAPHTSAAGVGAAPQAAAPAAGLALPPVMAPDSNLLAVGDSVMLGARARLLRALPGITVDAEVGRQPRQSVALVERYLSQNSDIQHAVIHIGTNGYILKSDLRRLLGALKDARQVVVVNNFADRRWTDANNQLIAQIVPEFANASVMDWHQSATGNRQFFVQDGVHLTSEGITAYVRGIARSLGITPLEVVAARPAAPRRAASESHKRPASAAQPASAHASPSVTTPAADAPPAGTDTPPGDATPLKSETQLKEPT